VSSPVLAYAFDRSTSSRWFDRDGRLHCVANISRAQVAEYLGREIPDAARYGLSPDATYRLFRDPAELAKAAPSFDLLPLLAEHHEVSADDPRPDLIVGASGNDSEFDSPFLRTSLVIWRQDAIDDIMSGARREISIGYRFDLDPQPGTYQGQPYDARMVNIGGSHIALVPDGRAGPSCAIDEAPQPAWLVRQEETFVALKRALRV